MKKLLILFTLLIIDLNIYCIAGTLDTTFGSGGFVTSSQFNGPYASITQLSDGSIIVSCAPTGTDNIIFLQKYSINGVFDSTFGTSGTATTSITANFEGTSFNNNIAAQSTDKIIVGGNNNTGSSATQFRVSRYNSDGTLDTTFGTGGTATTTLGAGCGLSSVLVVPSNNSIIAAGYSTTGDGVVLTLVKYNSEGVIDNTFGSSGITQTPVPGADEAHIFSIALQSGGQIIVGGVIDSGGTIELIIARYSSAGVLDNTFGDSGIEVISLPSGFTVAFGTTPTLFPNCFVAVNSDDTIIVGTTVSNGGIKNSMIVKYSSAGVFNNTFSHAGSLYTQNITISNILPPAIAETTQGIGISSIALQSNGQIITGEQFEDIDLVSVVRHNSNGSMDTAFGDQGIANPFDLQQLGTNDTIFISKIIIQSDGKILVCACLSEPGNAPYKLARYLSEVPTIPVASNNIVSASKNSTKSITLTATNSDQNLLTFSIVTGPTNGTLSGITQPDATGITQTATLNYTPTSGYVGGDFFTFKATNAGEDSNTAIVAIGVSTDCSAELSQLYISGSNRQSPLTRALIKKYRLDNLRLKC